MRFGLYITYSENIQEGDALRIRRADEDAVVYLVFMAEGAESFSLDDGKTVKTYAFDENGYYQIRIHEDCTVYLNGGTASVSYKEVIRDYEELIPEDYDVAEQLHFNLWLLEEYELTDN